METWLSALSEFGFPIVVTLYLLYRIEGKLDALNRSIQSLPYELLQAENASFRKVKP